MSKRESVSSKMSNSIDASEELLEICSLSLQESSTDGSLVGQRDVESNTVCDAAPFKCPLSNCNELVGITSVLAHFIINHQQSEENVGFQMVLQDEKICMLVMMEEYIQFEKNICFGVLAYQTSQLLTHCNTLLPQFQRHYENHLPILIMGCRISYARIENSELETNLPKDTDSIIIWLLSTEIFEEIFVTVTVYNEEENISISKQMRLRSIRDIQDPYQFIQHDVDYLRLKVNLVKDMTVESGSIKIEVCINEHFF
ncbi:unnamed protein product [Diamesa hyperborea]